MSSPISSSTSRRALLEKSSNTIISPSLHLQMPDDSMNKSIKASMTSDIASISPPAVVGQKRSIDQVDHNLIRSANSSFSQARLEEEFYIYEEPSQSSVDIDREASYLRSTVIAESRRDRPEQESQESIGMSSLLNLSQSTENSFSNTRSTKTQRVINESAKPRSIVPTDPEQRKLFVEQKANLLLRQIQAAMKALDEKQTLDRRLADFEARYQAQKRQWESTVEHLNQNPEIIASMGPTTPKKKIPKLDPSPPLHERGRVVSMVPSSRNTSIGETGDKALMSSMQLVSPGKGSCADPIVVDQDLNCSVERMMAKVKRGEALDGLLKLMETTTEYDALDEWTG
ncbi:hypothetical protein PRK78_000643 [Emydomyces testavorans]|uniref:Uncharacterized protein n=1 Tax=Emydomyces testavorans TaxID=2070801 RepID=A0AAF0IHT9_9EURO|nr:hypothetical protein PRK78_000643 [Emydomyces testavorans]